MGIPCYFSNLIQRHPQIFRQCEKTQETPESPKSLHFECEINQLCFDCNSIIYDVVRTVESLGGPLSDESVIIAGVIKKINEYVLCFCPTDHVVIAFDGVAPMAKMEQQRQRRYKSYFEKTYFQKYEDSSAARREVWNTAAITPGTPFMRRLSREIDEYYQSPPVSLQHLKFLVSTSEEPGEGEHKIFSLLRNQVEKNPDTASLTTLIYGLDADLFMLSLNHLRYHSSLYLYRETPDYIHSLQKELQSTEDYVIDIRRLLIFLESEMRDMGSQDEMVDWDLSLQLLSDVSIRYMRDYIFMCFFLGNDFLPHFPALNIRTRGMDKLMEAYREVVGIGRGREEQEQEQQSGLPDFVMSRFVAWNESDPASSYIRWSHVLEWLQNLAKKEEDYLRKELGMRRRSESRLAHAALDRLPDTANMESRVRALNVIPQTSREVEIYIEQGMVDRGGRISPWKQRYYDKLVGMQIQNDQNFSARQALCDNYLQGLEWTFFYYTVGCMDQRWKYRYQYPPLLGDLVIGLGNLLVEKKKRNSLLPCPRPDGWRWPWASHTKAVFPLTQLAYVLPRESLARLFHPEVVSIKLLAEFESWYPATDRIRFQWAFCKYFWESHALLPEIDIDVLETNIDQWISGIQKKRINA